MSKNLRFLGWSKSGRVILFDLYFQMVQKLKEFSTFHGNSQILDSTMAISELLGSLRQKSATFNFLGGASKTAFKNSELGPSAGKSGTSEAKLVVKK